MSLMKRIFSTESADRRLSIAFLDTGISPVEDFILPENRIVAFRDFINGRTAPYDDNGHGTHVTTSPNARESPSPVWERGLPEFNMSHIYFYVDEGQRVLTVIIEHTKCCHQNDAAVQQALCYFFRDTHIYQLLEKLLTKSS